MFGDWRMRWVACVGVVALVVGIAGGRLLAAEGDDQVHFDVNIGAWLTSVNGEVGIGRVQGDVDVDFVDLIKHANFVAMGGMELYKGKWHLIFNGVYAHFKDSLTGPRGFAHVDAEAGTGIADLALGYTIVRTKLGNGMPLTLMPAVGVRYTYLSLELDPERLRTVSGHEDWWDPYVGGRVVLGLTDHLLWRTEATIGGFGVGSDLTWSAAMYLDWKLSKSVTMNIGYRALAWDFENDKFLWDITLHGPWIGVTFGW